MKELRLVIYLLLYASIGSAQVIKSITFEGLGRTKPEYLLLFISPSKGDKLDSVLLNRDKQQLTNLEIINEVTYKIKGTDSIDIVFECEESGTFLPLFNFGGVKGNYWFRLGLSELNLNGRGNKIHAFYQFYDRHSLYIDYTITRVLKSKWDFNASVIKWATIEPLYFQEGVIQYDYDNSTYGLSLKYNINFHHNILVGGAYLNEHFKALSNEIFAPDNVLKKKVLFKIIYQADFVDHFHFFSNGWSSTLNLETVKTMDENVPFYIFFNDFKVYKRPWSRVNLAAKLRIGLSTNNKSPFAPFVLDSYINIRGAGNKVNRGTGTFTIKNKNRYAASNRNKVALQTIAFADLGSWRLPGGNFADFVDTDISQLFVGVGLRGIYKKIHSAIIRVDYAVNVGNTTEQGFVIGIGQYF